MDLIFRVFCEPKVDNIITIPPTYGMYAISAKSQGVDVVEVPQVNNQLDMPSLADQVNKVKVVFICSPGNPTGNLLPVEQIKQTIKLSNINLKILKLPFLSAPLEFFLYISFLCFHTCLGQYQNFQNSLQIIHESLFLPFVEL